MQRSPGSSRDDTWRAPGPRPPPGPRAAGVSATRAPPRALAFRSESPSMTPYFFIRSMEYWTSSTVTGPSPMAE